ncbi:hypothetical protein AeMF1_017693 [Aphanomyces euteiches]|nr:hypothetical protein AeMF1_017693 [Aphanomyces euteiches]
MNLTFERNNDETGPAPTRIDEIQDPMRIALNELTDQIDPVGIEDDSDDERVSPRRRVNKNTLPDPLKTIRLDDPDATTDFLDPTMKNTMNTDPAERIRQGKKRVSRRTLPATRHGLNTDQFVEDPKTTAQKGPTDWTPTWNLSGDRRSIPATRSVDETDPHMGHPTIFENTDPSTRIQDGEESVSRRIIPVTPNGEESVRRRIIPATPDGEETDHLGSVHRRIIPATPSDDTNYGEDYPTDDDLVGDSLLDEDTTPSTYPFSSRYLRDIRMKQAMMTWKLTDI